MRCRRGRCCGKVQRDQILAVFERRGGQQQMAVLLLQLVHWLTIDFNLADLSFGQLALCIQVAEIQHDRRGRSSPAQANFFVAFDHPATRHKFKMQRIAHVRDGCGAGAGEFTRRAKAGEGGFQGRCAVVAFDPMSPITSGALLGDRLRVDFNTLDESVYYRSLAISGEDDLDRVDGAATSGAKATVRVVLAPEFLA